jgi:hypothetical protein
MIKRMDLIALGILFLFSAGFAQETSLGSIAPEPFAHASVRFEQNATDGDVEVVYEIKGGDEGLAMLRVISPDDRPVIDFKAPDASTMGIRQFRFESPEPKDVESLKAAYTEGIYKFSGATADGKEYYSEESLSHDLPAVVSFIWPEPEADGVSIKDLEITWTPVEDVSGYIVEIEQEEMAVNILVKLPGSLNMFAMPNGFLVHGVEYTLSIGTESEEGNLSFVETSFITAGKE